MEARNNPLGWPTWAWRCLVALLLLLVAIGVDGSLANIVRATGTLHDIGDVGAHFTQPPGTRPGWVRVAEVEPGSAAARGGIESGDLVHFEGFFGYQAQVRADWPRPVLIERAGLHSRSVLRVEGALAANPSLLLMYSAQSLIELAFGVFLLIRGRKNHTAGMLGIILIGLGAVAGDRPVWVPNMAALQAVSLLLLPVTPLISYAWPRFSLAVSGGAASERQDRFVHLAAAGFAILSGAVNVLGAILVPIPFIGDPGAALVAVIPANQLFGYAVIASNYRRNDQRARNRIKIIVLAFVCFMLAALISQATGRFGGTGVAQTRLLSVRFALTAFACTGIALVAYAVLRQRLFDLRFALNRTLVYGAVSFILLAAFGLAEWGVEHLVPEAWHEGSAFFSAGIALALFLSFHRLRDWVERHVERLLFSSWHLNEAALRRFVDVADHFDQPPALCRNFARELSRFAQGADAALYLRELGDGFRLSAGKLKGARRHYAEDDRAFALLTGERHPIGLAAAHSDLPGALALPMLDQGKLTGLALLAHKPDRTDYRPDEIEVLGWAVQQIGLTLQAHHARELEIEIAALRGTVTTLLEERDRLHALLGRAKRPDKPGNGRRPALPA